MADSRRRMTSMILMLVLCVVMLGVLSANAYATSWWSDWAWDGNYANRAAVTVFDDGDVNAATQLYHATGWFEGCGLHARLYSGDVCKYSTDVVFSNNWQPEQGKIKITTPRFSNNWSNCYGWGRTFVPDHGLWQTHQTSRHDAF